MTEQPTKYRPCAGIMLYNQEGKIFVGQRADSKYSPNATAWQMPQGGIDEGEIALTAAFRELEEETGITEATFKAKTDTWLYYDLPDELIGKIWKGKYRGQKQKWFLMEYIGDGSDINVETEHQEFSEYKWVDIDELPDLVVPFKKELYEQVIEEFKSKL